MDKSVASSWERDGEEEGMLFFRLLLLPLCASLLTLKSCACGDKGDTEGCLVRLSSKRWADGIEDGDDD